jgi:hypothetical protein
VNRGAEFFAEGAKAREIKRNVGFTGAMTPSNVRLKGCELMPE